MILAALAAEAGLEAHAVQPVPDAAARAAEAAGRYLTNRRMFSGPAQLLVALSPLNVTALADGALLMPTATIPMPSRFDPIAPDLWQNGQGDRVTVIRDAQGQVARLADGTGAHTHERLRGLADPVWLSAGFALAALLATTTFLGLLWRHGLRNAMIPVLTIIGLQFSFLLAGGIIQRLAQQLQLALAQSATDLPGHLGVQHDQLPATEADIVAEQAAINVDLVHFAAVVVIAGQPELVRAQLGKIGAQALVGLEVTVVGHVACAQQDINLRLFAAGQADHCLQGVIRIHPQQATAGFAAQMGVGELQHAHRITTDSDPVTATMSGRRGHSWSRQDPARRRITGCCARPLARQCSSQSPRNWFCCSFSSCWNMWALG
jgi:hypothetical protein